MTSPDWDAALDSQHYTPPVVSRVEEEIGVGGTSSRVEPPLDQGWTQLTKLRWHAAVVQLDTGLPYLRVAEQRKTFRSPWQFLIWYDPYTSCSCAADYHEAWDFINHIGYGAKAMADNLGVHAAELASKPGFRPRP